jgi:hypothetical protein
MHLVLYEKDFGWMPFWELDPEVLGSLWPKATATWGGGMTLAEGPHDWERRAKPPLNCILSFAIQPRKSAENISQVSRVATGLLVAPTWLSSGGQPRLACCTLFHLGYPWDFRQPSVGTGAFQVAGPRVSPHQLTLGRNPQSAL